MACLMHNHIYFNLRVGLNCSFVQVEMGGHIFGTGRSEHKMFVFRLYHRLVYVESFHSTE